MHNLELRQGDATSLPYEDASFDGAFLVTVLGEIPDQEKALRELRRVLRPGGRVVFGETVARPAPRDPAVPARPRPRRPGCASSGWSGVAPLGFYARFAAA